MSGLIDLSVGPYSPLEELKKERERVEKMSFSPERNHALASLDMWIRFAERRAD